MRTFFLPIVIVILLISPTVISSTIDKNIINNLLPPIADAGPDQFVDVNEIVQFNGTGSYDPNYRQAINVVDISGDGNYIVIGWGTNITLFHLNNSEPLWTFNTEKTVVAVVLSENGTYLATAQNDDPSNTWESRGYVSFFNTNQSTPIWTYQTNYPIYGTSRRAFDMTRDGNYIALGTFLSISAQMEKVGKVYLFETNSGSPINIFDFPQSVLSVRFSGDGTHFAAGSFWYEIRYYGISEGFIFKILPENSDYFCPIYTISLDYYGNKIAAGQGDLQHTQLFNNNGNRIWVAESLGKHIGMVTADNGQYIATAEYKTRGASTSHGFRLFSNSSSSPIWTHVTSMACMSLDMATDGQYIFGGNQDGGIYQFTPANGTPESIFYTNGIVNHISCSFDGNYYAGATSNGTLYVFTTAGGSNLLWQWDNAKNAEVLSYSWDFNANIDTNQDGNPTNDIDAIGSTPTHKYESIGVYTVTLNVTSTTGLYSIDTLNVTVYSNSTATATGPQGAGHDPIITITYNWTETPTEIDLFYSTNHGDNWNCIGTDASVDGSFDWTPESNPCPKPSKFYWIANAKGGADDVGIPANGTAPEAGPFNWKTFDVNTDSNRSRDGTGYWTFVSVPLTVHTRITAVFNDVLYGDGGTTWDRAMWFDTQDAADPWKSFNKKGQASSNDMPEIDNTMGIWLHITDNGGDGVLTAGEGIMPASTSISLHTGWNMVGYPARNSEMTVAEALSGTGADRVEAFDSVSPYIKEAGPTYIMKPGEGYWVHVPTDTIWTVDW